MRATLKEIGRDLRAWVGSPSQCALTAALGAWAYANGAVGFFLGLAVFYGLLSLHGAIARALAPGNLAHVEINYGSVSAALGREAAKTAREGSPGGARW